jgi:stage II sporulation protein D
MKKLIAALLLSLLLIIPINASATNEFLPQSLRVGLEREFENVSRISIDNNYLSVGHNIGGVFTQIKTVESAGGFTVTAGGGQFALYSGNQAVMNLDDSAYAIQIRDGNGGNVELDGTHSIGIIELYRKSKQNITAVNVLTPDEYLYSIVASEMTFDFHAEALKAQGVAARNYLLTRMGIHKSEGYDMCDSGHCLLYRGASRNHELSNAAVDATSGQLIYYEGLPISATFFSSSGGSTDNAENVWNEAVPYLRGVSDMIEYEAPTWTRTFSWNEITNLLAADNTYIGTANGMAVTKTGAGGRVLELTIYATSGKKVIDKEDIRSFFSPSRDGSLDSRNFSIIGGDSAREDTTMTATNGTIISMAPGSAYYVLNNDGQASALNRPPRIYSLRVATSVSGGNGVTIEGSGWGHGVGLSQRGAEGLARQGYSYLDILHHYYTGVEIY